jgi:hypothetical protein
MFALKAVNTGRKLPISHNTFDSTHIYLHLADTISLTARELPELSFLYGMIRDEDGKQVPYFRDWPVKNNVPLTDAYVTLIVKDAETQNPLSGVEIVTDTLTDHTNLQGKAIIVVPIGLNNVQLTKDTYLDLVSNLQISSDTTIELFLRSALAYVKFVISDNESRIYKAEISLDGQLLTTNTLGLAVFWDVEINREYEYIIGKEGYDTIRSGIMLVADTTIELSMQRTTGLHHTKRTAVSVYPVPSRDVLTVEADDRIDRIRIYNIYGELIREISIQSESSQLDIEMLSPGVYLLNILLNNRSSHNTKFIKQHQL